MALLDAIIEKTSVNLPGQDRPVAAPAPRAPVSSCIPGFDEARLQKWRGAVEDEIRTRALKCLTDTFDKKNSCGKGASPAMKEARAAHIRRVESADFATLLEMVKWAEPGDKKYVFDAFVVVGEQFVKPTPGAPRARP